MALVSCPECGKQVSTDATQCPGCGAYTGNVPDKRKIIMRFAFLAVLIAVIGWVLGG